MHGSEAQRKDPLRQTLPKAELDKSEIITEAELKEALAEGKRQRELAQAASRQIRSNPKLRYRR